MRTKEQKHQAGVAIAARVVLEKSGSLKMQTVYLVQVKQ